MKKNLTIIGTMLKLLADLENCLKQKCKIETKQFKKNTDYITINKLREDFNNNKISQDKFLSEFSKIKLKLLKSDARDEIIKCQLNNCYSETKTMIDKTVSTILNNNNNIYKKDEPIYKLAKKLLKYKGKKITLKDLKDIDILSHERMYGRYIKN